MNIRYWIYTGTPGVAKIHRSSCGHCLDGKGGGQKAEHIGAFWYGFYATKGAALDAAEAGGWELQEDGCMRWE